MSNESKPNLKVTGYLLKRCKLKLVNSWKRYWFVLEGHLLLYYGSKEEYDALSPCKGTITLGPTCNVKPYASTPDKFQITTRTGSVITLRAENIAEQNKWMRAIYSTVNENQKLDMSPTMLCHFRYFTGRQDVFPNDSEVKKGNSSPVPADIEPSSPKTPEIEGNHLLGRLQKMGAISYFDSMASNNHTKSKMTAIPKKSSSGPNEENLRTEKQVNETAPISPKKLYFTPKIAKIKEEPRIEDEEVVIEEDDYCVCTYGKNDDSEVSEVHESPRSISFSDARDVFNQIHLGRLSGDNSAPKTKEGGCDKSVSENIELSPREKLRILTENVIHPPKHILKNESVVPTPTNDNDEARHSIPDVRSQKKETTCHNKDAKSATETRSSEPIKKYTNKYEKSATLIHDQEPQKSKQNNIAICSVSTEKRKQGISDNENGGNKVEEKHPSYQDFRENELYAIPHENIPLRVELKETREEQSGSSVVIYDEPIFLEEIQKHKDKPDFEFPPPPNEAYESNVDLTSNLRYDDDDSLYEEAQDNINEELVWQNEIYESSDNPNKDRLCYGPNFQEQVNSDNKEHSQAHKIDEFNNDYESYEEIDRNFEFLRTPTDEVVFENEIYAEPDFRKYPVRPSSQAQVENDLYEEVNIGRNHAEHLTDKEEQIDNDLYARTNQLFFDSSQQPKNEREIDDLYAKPNKKRPKELTKPNNLPSISGPAEEVLNDLYANPDEIIHKDNSSRSDKTDIKKPNSPREELQIENDLYAVPNLVLCKESSRNNDNYKAHEKSCPANEELQHNPYRHHIRHTEECVQLENEIYTEPNIISTETFSKPIFSRQNSRSDQEQVDMVESNKPHSLSKASMLVHKLLHFKPRHPSTDGDVSVDLENELYAQPNLNFKAQKASTLPFYDKPNLKVELGKDAGEDNLHFYEDPDMLMSRPQKVEDHTKKKKPKNLHKGNCSANNPEAEEVKKQDGFIQRLLKQATKKHADKSDKSGDFDTKSVDETLAILADIQVLLEKKKKVMKEMVVNSPKTNHRRILSESNAPREDRERISASTSNDLPLSSSFKEGICIGLTDENLVVQKDNEEERVQR